MSLKDAFPTPWKITDTGSAFRVMDARGRAVAYVYYRREAALRNEFPTQDEAREMAREIARLSKAK
jgi:hypothetical protein